MHTDRVDKLNIALMLVSCALAFALPFELFLLAYAVLGPLHYLTQIAWLQKRDYFAPARRGVALLVLFAVATTLAVHSETLLGWTTGWDAATRPAWAAATSSAARSLAVVLPFAAFAVALVAPLVQDSRGRVACAAAILLLGFALESLPGYAILFGVLLTTLIHVFLFTGCFILYGALRNRSRLSLLSLVVFLGCAASFALIHVDPAASLPSDSVRSSYDRVLLGLNLTLVSIFSSIPADARSSAEALRTFVYESPPAQAVARFVAFAYTYHYLNWFSKTSIIRWHEVPPAWLAAILVTWLASVALYAVDYIVGLGALFFLSILHVYLEFPLNWRTFTHIGRELRRISSSSPAG